MCGSKTVAQLHPDLALVAACCRWPDDDARRQAIRAAAAKVVDWEACLNLAAAHRVTGFVGQGVEWAGVELPQDLARGLSRRRQEIRQASLVQLGETVRLSAALRGGGVEHRVLKGIPLALVAYGTAAMKQSWDIDLLVRPEQAVTAATILRELGFRTPPPARNLDSSEFHRWAVASKDVVLESERGVVVELHWRLSDHPRLLKEVGVNGEAREVTLLGERSVPTLSDADNLAYLAVHGAFHGWSRLKWLGDYAALLKSFDKDGRKVLLARARSSGAARAINQANSLCDRFLGSALAGESGGSDNPRFNELGEYIIQRRAAGKDLDADRSAQFRIRRAQWLLMPKTGDRLILLLGWLRGSEDRKHIPLPARLHAIYWVMRPFTAAYRFSARHFRR